MKRIEPIRLTGRILVALSGGADSTALLRLLHDGGTEILAVHCNFGLRGADSDRDEDFCRCLCDGLGIPLLLEHYDTRAYIKEHRVSLELACRELRYGSFRRIMRERHCSRIATAHHADDNAETLLLKLMRGAGLNGLSAMRPDNGEIIRPLLSYSKDEILDYLASIGQEYVTDATNFENDADRNFLRNRVMPMLAERWPGCVDSINRSIRNLQNADTLCQSFAQDFLDSDLVPENFLSPENEEILHRILDNRGAPSNVTEEVMRAYRQKNVGAKWRFASGLAVLERDGLHFVPADSEPPEIEVVRRVVVLTEDIKKEILSSDNQALWLPLGVADQLVFRPVRRGDRIRQFGRGGSKLVSDIMKDAKLSQAGKKETIVAEHIPTKQLLWVKDLKRSALFPVDFSQKSAEKIEIFCRKRKKE